MVRTLNLIFCIFLTSGFAIVAQAAPSNYCFENSNTSGVMPLHICFQDIQALNWNTANQSVYLRNQIVNDVFPVSRIDKTSAGVFAIVKGDYLNYVKTCGLTILSKFEIKVTFDSNLQYVHGKKNSLVIKYEHTPDNCLVKARSGKETFKVIDAL